MNHIVKSASIFEDPENQQTGIRVEYTVKQPGDFCNDKTEWIYAKPKGTWKGSITFEDVTYPDFLDLMVYKSEDVLRKMCSIRLQSILICRTPRDTVGLVQLIEIIDPTFVAPSLNKNCRWQCEFSHEFCNTTFLTVISTCVNKQRLYKLYYELTKIDKYEYDYSNDQYY